MSHIHPFHPFHSLKTNVLWHPTTTLRQSSTHHTLRMPSCESVQCTALMFLIFDSFWTCTQRFILSSECQRRSDRIGKLKVGFGHVLACTLPEYAVLSILAKRRHSNDLMVLSFNFWCFHMSLDYWFKRPYVLLRHWGEAGEAAIYTIYLCHHTSPDTWQHPFQLVQSIGMFVIWIAGW